MAVRKSDKFDVRFTLYDDTKGEPVERPLREMSSAEVLLAMDCLTCQIEMIKDQTHPIELIAGRTKIGPDELKEFIQFVVQGMCEAAALTNKMGRLMGLIDLVLQPWLERDFGMTRSEAIHRFWPFERPTLEGRAAALPAGDSDSEYEG
jgi:hypothetical protein